MFRYVALIFFFFFCLFFFFQSSGTVLDLEENLQATIHEEDESAAQ